MRDPKPINLMTSEDVRAAGHWAERRDADGHLIGTLSREMSSFTDLIEFVADTRRDETIAIWADIRHEVAIEHLTSLGMVGSR